MITTADAVANDRPQKVKNGTSEKTKNLASHLQRTTFETSLQADWLTERQLIAQIGHERSKWAFVAVKELIDNSLDACEESGTAPIIVITANEAGLSVHDNGPGLPEKTLQAALDFTIRASSREAYVAPDRGKQGNAMKTLIAMPHILGGWLTVEANGTKHKITCGSNAISGRAEVHDQPSRSPIKKGTRVSLEWDAAVREGDWVWPFSKWPVAWSHDEMKELVATFAVFNPHASFVLNWFGETVKWNPSSTSWQKFAANQGTSSHWYEQEHFERLIGAHVSNEMGHRLVSDFIAEFDGLSGSAKRASVLEDAELKRANLSALVTSKQQFEKRKIAKLLKAMKRHSKPIRAERLGMIGEDHMRQQFLAMGVEPESFRYSKKLSKDGLPWVLEVAFGWLGRNSLDERKFFAGVNWSAAIGNPFRTFGSSDEGLEGMLVDLKAGQHEPIVLAVHLIHPRVEYTDRGKSALIVRDAGGDALSGDDITAAVKAILKPWTKQRRAEERGNRTADERGEDFRRRVCFTHVVDQILPDAYMHASGNGTLPVMQRQFFYASREKFREMTGKRLNQARFNKLLRQYMNRNADSTENWKVTADSRGTLVIPNTGYDYRVPCGTLAIEDHLRRAAIAPDPFEVNARVNIEWPSIAARQRIQALVYIEKEGFEPLIKQAKIAERYDVAFFSCKGQSNVAARKLVDEVCAIGIGIPLLVIHDFDKAGFEIAQRLTTISSAAEQRDEVAYRFKNQIDIHDLGLRLADAKKYDLPSEYFKFNGTFAVDSPCTDEEKSFLRSNRRVELNAFTSPQFVEWIEEKLTEHLPRRLVPADDVLQNAYRRAVALASLNKSIEAARQVATARAEAVEIPDDLREMLVAELEREGVAASTPEAWDKVLYRLAAAAKK